MGIFRVSLYLDRYIGQCGRQFLHAAGLLRSTLCQGLGTVGDLAGPGIDLAGGSSDGTHGIIYIMDKLQQRLLNLFHLAREVGIGFSSKVAITKTAQYSGDLCNDILKLAEAVLHTLAGVTEFVPALVADVSIEIPLRQGIGGILDLRERCSYGHNQLAHHQQTDNKGNYEQSKEKQQQEAVSM